MQPLPGPRSFALVILFTRLVPLDVPMEIGKEVESQSALEDHMPPSMSMHAMCRVCTAHLSLFRGTCLGMLLHNPCISFLNNQRSWAPATRRCCALVLCCMQASLERTQHYQNGHTAQTICQEDICNTQAWQLGSFACISRLSRTPGHRLSRYSNSPNEYSIIRPSPTLTDTIVNLARKECKYKGAPEQTHALLRCIGHTICSRRCVETGA